MDAFLKTLGNLEQDSGCSEKLHILINPTILQMLLKETSFISSTSSLYFLTFSVYESKCAKCSMF